MSNLTLHHAPGTSNAIVLPEPRGGEISIRVATLDDVKFVDALQKKHSKMVGFLFLESLEKKTKAGHVLIAEEARNTGAPGISPVPLGYCIFQDKYDKHDDCGIFYQVNVVPGNQRGLIGAALVKAHLERAAYGCKLACCWCAQDLQANHFWESLGFVPLAFRTGSRKVRYKDGTSGPRIHIFWQRRIREGDLETPYWFPAKTEGGAIAEDRIVLPIPPGTHWRDVNLVLLPELPARAPEMPLMLPGGQPVRIRPEKPQLTKYQRAALARSQSAHLGAPPLGKKAVIRGGRIKYIDIPGFDPSVDGPDELAPLQKPKKPRAPRQKNDPEYVAAARELRDRYLEAMNLPENARFLPEARGKYDVSRQLEAAPTRLKAMPLLDAA